MPGFAARSSWLLCTLALLGPATLWAQPASAPLVQANSVSLDLRIDSVEPAVTPTDEARRGADDDRLAELARRLAQAESNRHPDEQQPAAAPLSLPSPAPAVSIALDADEHDPRAALPVSPNEQRSLGRLPSKGAADAEGGAVADPGSSWMLRTLGALGLVIALVFVLRGLVARVAGLPVATAHSPVVEVLCRVSVAPRSHVLLVRLGQKVLVLGDGAGGLRTLAQLDDPDEVAHILATVSASKPNSVSQSFSQLVSRFSSDYTQRDRFADEGADKQEVRFDQAREQVSGLLSRLRGMAKGELR